MKKNRLILGLVILIILPNAVFATSNPIDYFFIKDGTYLIYENITYFNSSENLIAAINYSNNKLTGAIEKLNGSNFNSVNIKLYTGTEPYNLSINNTYTPFSYDNSMIDFTTSTFGDITINTIAPETCNNIDDDNDGLIDENLTRATTCGVGACANNTGEETCTLGIWGNNTCNPFAGATAETCNNIDDDCDGEIDEPKNTEADLDCNGCIDNNEFTAYVNKWINVEVSNENFVIAAIKWIILDGC